MHVEGFFPLVGSDRGEDNHPGMRKMFKEEVKRMILRISKWASIAVFAVLLSSCSAAPKGETAGWIQWRGPNGNGTIVDPAFNPGFAENKGAILWKTAIDGGYSAVAVTDTRLYTLGGSKKNGKNTLSVYCLDPATGKSVWTQTFDVLRSYQWPGPRAMPLLAGGKMYVVGSGGETFCLNPENGKKIWARDILAEEKLKDNTWGVSSTPVLADGKLLLNIGGGIALDPENGKTIWKGPNVANGYSSAVVCDKGGEKRVFFFVADNLVMLRLADGKELARFPWKTAYDIAAADPMVLPGDKVLISTSYRDIGCALLDFSGDVLKEIWSGKAIGSQFSSLVEHKGLVFGIDGDTNARPRCMLTCMDPMTGKVLWSEKTGCYGSLIKVNDTLVYLNEHGFLSAVEPVGDGYRRGAALRVFTTQNNGWVAPSYWKGRLYLRSNIGDLVCVKADK